MPLFDELRAPETRMPNGGALPLELFEFTTVELSPIPGLRSLLVPSHASVESSAASASVSASRSTAAAGSSSALADAGGNSQMDTSTTPPP